MKTRIKVLEYENGLTKYKVQAYRLWNPYNFSCWDDDPISFWGCVIAYVPYFIFYLTYYLFIWQNKSIYDSLEDAKKEIDNIYHLIDAKNLQKEKDRFEKIEKLKAKKTIKKTYLKYP